jgi:hypothetical protein
MQKGQIFVLGAIGLVVALFLITPNLQKEIYLPSTDYSQLKNIAKEYNYWIAYSSLEENYNILDFGSFVKENYPNLEFFYLLAEEDNLKVANFFDNGINFSINGRDFSLEQNNFVSTGFSRNINFSSEYKNFNYSPKNKFSGAIFLRIDKGISKLQLLKIFE